MPTNTPTTAPVVTPEPKPEPKPTVLTKWEVFERAKLVPTDITCAAYRAYHPMDSSCHSKVLINPENMIRHMDADHSGGFTVHFRVSDKGAWTGWKYFKEQGIELADFRCEVCDKQLPLSGQHIASHMRVHKGKFRGAQNLYRDTFSLTISRTAPLPTEDDDVEPFEN